MAEQVRGALMAAWPLCAIHGRLQFRVNEPGSSYYECCGYDGEGCQVMLSLSALEDWWVGKYKLPPGIDVVWTDLGLGDGRPVIELGGTW